MQFIEVEVKFPLLNPDPLKKRLGPIAARQTEGDFQKDSYFTPAHRNFIEERPISEWFRIRAGKEGKACSANYKNFHKKERGLQATHCDEFETGIGSEKDFEKILQALDFKEVAVVEKSRSTWLFKDVEIALDNVKGLGWFIELEYKGSAKNVEEAKKHLYAILKELNAKVGEQVFKGYPQLVLEKNGKKFD